MSAVVASGLSKRYGRRWALQDCDLTIPQGRVVGLVGANGAGKTTLLNLAVGLAKPTTGHLTVLGGSPGDGSEQLARVGFVTQDASLYPSLTVAEHLRLGRAMNARWDGDLALSRVERLQLDPSQRTSKLSGGQRTQLALTLAMGKRPDLLLLDEPVASLDPLARRDVLGDLMELVAEQAPTVVLSSHDLADVERICDHLVVLASGRVMLAGAIDDLLAAHRIWTGPRREVDWLPGDHQVIRASHTARQTTALVRSGSEVLDPRVIVSNVGLEDLVLAYMTADDRVPPARLSAVAS